MRTWMKGLIKEDMHEMVEYKSGSAKRLHVYEQELKNVQDQVAKAMTCLFVYCEIGRWIHIRPRYRTYADTPPIDVVALKFIW